MKVKDIMTREVLTCRQSDSLHSAASLMWDHDCGCVPVLNDDDRVIAMLTDRDICMAAYSQGRPVSWLPVAGAMSKTLHTCAATDSLAAVRKTMRSNRVRRLPVIDSEDRLVGILSLGDLARESVRASEVSKNGVSATHVGETLSAICSRGAEETAPSGARRTRRKRGSTDTV